MGTKEEIDFVKWFSELDKNSGPIAGGKGANLGEIYNKEGIPVPPGFVVTAQAYDYFIEKAGIKDKIQELLNSINYEDTKQLDKITKEIRALIENANMPEKMREDIIEAYENLDIKNENVTKGSALDILKVSEEPIFVAVRSSATTEDLAEASFAGQQDTFLNIKGNNELIKHVKKCFASLFTSRATYYRNKKNFDNMGASLAVIVQDMIDSEKSGVIFSKDPAKKTNNIIIEAVWGIGEGIVSGKITPDNYIVSPEEEILKKVIADKKIAITRDSSGNKKEIKLREDKSKHQVLTDAEIKKLTEYAITLEEHYQKPQDIEFAIEKNEIHIVQTRPITTIASRSDIEQEKELTGEVILTGLAASPGIASGKIKIIEDLKDLDKVKPGNILVTKMTNPDMVVTMQKSAAIVTDEGGLTSHAAIISREMGIPAVVGTQEATTKLKDNETITVDGFAGKVYKGKTSETKLKEILPITAQTKTKIKVIVDLPSFAKRATESGIKEIGLTRIEGIIAESGKHPEYFLKQNKMQDYEEVIFKGVDEISKYFDKIWVRTSDIRTDEFQNLEGAPQEKEANPMLGMHGIRYSLKNPEIFKAELRALKRIAESGKEIGILLPQVILVEEVKKTKEILKEINFNNAKIGVMIETPASVQIIRDLCEEGIDFISFGTNDLTQYMLAVDRGNEEVQELYNEMHPAILYQIGFVIRVCKKYKVESSICGQSGSRKEMVKILVENKIDSISVNADMAKEISDYVAELEQNLVKGTDKEPRQYQPQTESLNKSTNKEPQPATGEKLEQDLEAIEKEKQEYLKEHPEEEMNNNNQSIDKPFEKSSALSNSQAKKSGEANQSHKPASVQNTEDEDKPEFTQEDLDIFNS